MTLGWQMSGGHAVKGHFFFNIKKGRHHGDFPCVYLYLTPLHYPEIQ